MINEEEIQNELLDRLVDGELTDGDYRQVICRLEESEDGWRRCALSFLEQQALQRDLRQLLKDRQRIDLPEDVGADLDDVESIESPRVTNPNHWERWLGQPWVRWTSVLAVGVLAFVGGIALRPFDSSPGTAGGLAENNGDAESSNPRPNDFAASPNVQADGATLYIDDPTAGSSRSLQVPVWPIGGKDNQDALKFAPEQLPPQIATAFGKSNHPNWIERRFFVMRTDDGRVFILPFDRIIPGDNFQ